MVQWSENLVRTSPRSWNFPVLWEELADLDKRDDLLENVVLLEIWTELEDIGGWKESWFPKRPPDPLFELLSTTSMNSVNCFVRNGVLSPLNRKKKYQIPRICFVYPNTPFNILVSNMNLITSSSLNNMVSFICHRLLCSCLCIILAMVSIES